MTEPLPSALQDVAEDLAQCIEAMGPYTESAVLTGGLAPVLYRSIYGAGHPSRPPMTTFDMDIVLPRKIDFHPDGLHKLLQAGGFVSFLSGGGDKPVTHYQHRRHGTTHRGPIYLEFIAPRKGGMTDRKGENDGVVEVEKDLHAQTDPYVGLLLFEPLLIDAASIPALGLSASTMIQVSHPMNFIVQKCLIRDKRSPEKRANDAAHIYDVAMLTFSIWSEMAERLRALEEARPFPSKWFQRVRQTLHDLFATDRSPGVVEVAYKYRAVMGNDAPTEDAICRAMNRFVEATGLGIGGGK